MTLGLGQQHKVLRFDRKTDGPFSKSGLIIPYYVQVSKCPSCFAPHSASVTAGLSIRRLAIDMWLK